MNTSALRDRNPPSPLDLPPHITAVATPSPADKAPAPSTPRPSGFAELLRQHRAEASPPAPPAPAAKPTVGGEARETADPAAPTIESKAAATNAAKARAAAPKGATGQPAVANRPESSDTARSDECD